ncbi:MAG: septum site-determining protein MinC [Microcoleus vaginatus WJT46-NPBG5]|jgi:septum site-determining protein MinC|nr:septum site-determining protein MinC [Microcoleus vaginatus WJT46-NPBG5]
MTSDSSPTTVPTVPESPREISRHQQVRFKSKDGRLLLLLPPESENTGTQTPASNWQEIWQQMKVRLNAGERFWQPSTEVHLIAGDRLLDVRQLQALADALGEVQLELTRVHTSRRQTAVAAATAGYSVEQISSQTPLQPTPEAPAQAFADPLYLETTVRSGVEIRHPGTVILMGDVNPGGAIVAEGDILIWGRLRGVAHAGAGGKAQCAIMALQMEPTQIRIADFVARAPEKPPAQYHPEVAYVTPQGIRITKAADFSRTQLISPAS